MEGMDILMDADAVFRKAPHLIAGMVAALFWLWVAERQWVQRITNPFRDEADAILAKLGDAKQSISQAEAEIVKGAALHGAIVKTGVALFMGILACWL